MEPGKKHLLCINSGSSSIKFAAYEFEANPGLIFQGTMAATGGSSYRLLLNDSSSPQNGALHLQAANTNEAIELFLDWLESKISFSSVKAIGHRLVHGMNHTSPELISHKLTAALKQMIPLDPDHLPSEIALIDACSKRYPFITQVACFDTFFHTSMPAVAKRIAIPASYAAKGVHRYGFHGLSYTYLLGNLRDLYGAECANGRIIIAHLGNGASLAAIKAGKSIDTSMGFTPTSGLPMSTRSGDLDPGVVNYLLQQEHFTPVQFNKLVNHQSGLLGISETTGDMQELLKICQSDHRAAEAIDYFCYHTKKWIGAYTAALGGLETLVFSGGIGEHLPGIRSSICEGLEFLGIATDDAANQKNAPVISTATSRVKVLVMPTNEEQVIAQMICGLLNETT